MSGKESSKKTRKTAGFRATMAATLFVLLAGLVFIPRTGDTTASASTMDVSYEYGAGFTGSADTALGYRAEIADGWVLGPFSGTADGTLYEDGLPWNGIAADGTVYFDGVPDPGYTGPWESDGKLYYLQNGCTTDTTGLLMAEDGHIYCLADGIVDETYSGVVPIDGAWAYIDRGYSRTVIDTVSGKGTRQDCFYMYGTEGSPDWTGAMWIGDETYGVLCGTTMLYSPVIGGEDGDLTVDMALPLFGTSDARIKEVNKALALLPRNMLEQFVNDGGIIFVSARDDLGDSDPDWIGVAYYPQNVIAILDDKKNNDPECVIHEIGHYVDARESRKSVRNAWASDSDEWQAIYKAEWGAYQKAFAGDIAGNCTDATEYFAEAFEEYFTRHGELKSACPRTEKFLADIISQYTG